MSETNTKMRRRGPMGGRGMAPAEKAKDFKGSIKKLISYIGRYKVGIFFVMIFAAVSTVFSVVGPKVLGKATTELATGLQNKIAGTGGIDLQESDRSCSLCWHCMRSVPFSAFSRDGS